MNTSQQPDWEGLFPDSDFSFSFGVRPGDAHEFFSGSATGDSVMQQRHQALREAPSCHLFETPEATQAVAESVRWAGLTEGGCLQLALHWEPDFLILLPEPEGQFLFRAGAVCFPSSWCPEDKIGLPLHAIHSPVPTLNENLGKRIDKFLTRLSPDKSWQRFNWGISGSPVLNQHPRLNNRNLIKPLDPHNIWMRIEDQILLRLPETGAVIFGIRPVNVRLVDIKQHPKACAGLYRAIRTMPDNIADYKSISPIRAELMEYLMS
ncbi:MAG: DUF3445 domain-containing protein [Verrucomicrobiaceae bacterium]|nr:DUF3445 domain-containing protein [Verrucomicrobiaceae bacterium]